MAQYPVGLPIAQVSDYAVDINHGVSSVLFERGNTRQRHFARQERHSFTISIVLSLADLWTWQSWANQYGYDWHYMPMVSNYSGFTGSKPVPHYIRYTSDISIQMLGADYVRVSVQAELDVNTLPQGAVDFTGNWYVGGTPAAPSSSNWILGGTPAAPSANNIIAGSPAYPAA